MANIVRDPREHPDAILPDLSKPDPLVKFTKDDIALYGSLWKQRYFTKVGNDYYVESAQWDVENHVWRPYFVENNGDWWARLYPADNMKRPTGDRDGIRRGQRPIAHVPLRSARSDDTGQGPQRLPHR